MATTDLGNGITPGYQYEVEPSKVQQFDVSTSDSDSSRGSPFAGVGKEGEGMGKLRKESSRNMPDTTFDLPITRLPDPQPR
jgi:hypothetical protein